MNLPLLARMVACRDDMTVSLKQTSQVGSRPMTVCGLSVCSSPLCGPLRGITQPSCAPPAPPTAPPCWNIMVFWGPPPPGGAPKPPYAPVAPPPAAGAPPGFAPPIAPCMLMQNGHLSQVFSCGCPQLGQTFFFPNSPIFFFAFFAV